MKRSEIRELAFKLIYSLEIQKEDNLSEQLEIYFENNSIEDNKAKEYIADCIYGIEKNKTLLSKEIFGRRVLFCYLSYKRRNRKTEDR